MGRGPSPDRPRLQAKSLESFFSSGFSSLILVTVVLAVMSHCLALFSLCTCSYLHSSLVFRFTLF
uniref:Uncharacterized protein n=1 Tax=Triticum urartu TaxID=4572 RepID=A0A8R7V960_TRIUA